MRTAQLFALLLSNGCVVGGVTLECSSDLDCRPGSRCELGACSDREWTLGPCPGEPSQLTWSEGAPMPTPRAQAAAVVAGKRIYVLGGTTGSNSAIVEVYDPKAETWARVSPLPVPLRSAIVGVVDDRIYVAAGRNGPRPSDPEVSFAVYRYQPESDQWELRAPIPIDGEISPLNFQFAGGVLGSRLIGCFYDRGVTPTSAYDPILDSWRVDLHPNPLTSPTNLAYAAAVSGERLYLVANDDSMLAQVQMASFDGQDWVVRPDLPQHGLRRARATLVGAMPGLLAIGGLDLDSSGSIDSVDLFDPDRGTWSSLPSLPTARHDAAAVSIENRVFVIGGFRGAIPTDRLEIGCLP